MMDETQVVNWLLESEIPTIRYKTMLDLLHNSPEHEKCHSAYQEIQTTGAVPAILNQQVEMGHWKYPQHYYTPKYTSTHWTMMLLEELMIDPQEPRFQSAIEFMLSSTQNKIGDYIGENSSNWTCLWGNIIRYCVYGGALSDPRLQRMIELTAESLHNKQCQCEWNWQLPCVWGAARSIWGLISIPKSERSELVESAIQSGSIFVLKNVNLIISNQPSQVEKKNHPIWQKLNFPIFYQADILFILRLLYEMDKLDHPLASNLISWLESKQKKNGRWQGSSPFRQRTYQELGDKEETSRWVTLQSSLILKKARNYA